MAPPDRSRLMLAALLAGGAISCASTHGATPRSELAPGRLDPSSAAEAQVLQGLGKLPPGAELAVGGQQLAAQPPYYAASGRVCRALQPQDDAEAMRLACKLDSGWTLVPTVFPVVLGGNGEGP